MKPLGPGLGALVAAALVGIALPAKAQTPAGGEFRVNAATTGYQLYPSVARSGRGSFVVVWDDRNDYIVKGQRFDRGGSRVGAEFNVNQSDGYMPAVAMGPKGDFVVVWGHYPDGSVAGIRGRRFDASGNPRGAEFQVNTYTTFVQRLPNVAVDGQGNFVVVWWSDGQDGNGFGMVAQRFDALGNRRGAEFVVNSYTLGNQTFGDVSTDAAGNFVIAWTSNPGTDGTAFSVDAQRYDASGVPRGANFRVNSYTTGNQFSAGVAHAPDGSFVVAFLSVQTEPAGDVIAKRYAADGSAIGAEFRVNTYTTGAQGYPDIAMDGRGNFVVSWWDFVGDGNDRGLRARRFLADGTPRGDDFVVNSYTTGRQVPHRMASTIASDEVGNFVIDWWGPAPGGALLDTFARRFGGLHPSALLVDTTGNLVWEPGETVDVKPEWLNVNGAAQIPGGGLTNLSGPAGPTYTITDGAAIYPSIPNNASAGCADCYAVSVTAPATRPVQHWDASALETLSPDTQGQVKRWTLHIGGSFTDVPPGNGFNRFIETLFHYGITGGCGGTSYCPGTSTARDQMAVFVLVAKEGAGYVPPACTTPVFNDVPASSPFCRFVEELFRRGVVSGCGGNNYCPADPVTREQMSIFTLRTLDPALNPPACVPPNLFNDVPESSPFCRWIEELARRAVVTGCGGGNYCPTDPVTREQMGVFISATFGLTLYGP